MNNGPKNKKPTKNVYIPPLDLNIVNPFKDISGVNFKNPVFTPLQISKKKNLLLLKNAPNKNNPNNLETTIEDFNMTITKILEKIQNGRKDAIYSRKNAIHSFITKSLDNKANDSFADKDTSLKTLLKNIDNNYNKINAPPNSFFSSGNHLQNNYSLTNQKLKNTCNIYGGMAFPPPIAPPQRIPPPIPIRRELVNIQVEINSLADLLKLISDYPLAVDKEYNINMAAIHKIEKPLKDLDNMIGMATLKSSIVDQILYFVQNLHRDKFDKNGDFMHTVIYGPPGTGKTEVAKIMGEIFSKLGILSNNKFKKVVRADLIAGYLGQTAIKTQGVIKECIGGVLFIDEAYALGNAEKRDSFAKECIDTLCEALSDNKENLMVIIAGYEKELKKCFFAYNQGLDSRFTWRFKTDDYKESELNLILQKKITEANWEIVEKLNDDWFKSKMDYFKYYGRDMETLFAKTKIAHSRRVFCLPIKDKKKLIKRDFDKGFDLFLANDEVKSRKNGLAADLLNSMYC
jgi:chromosomal replication initiation ATPase DnaA